MYLEFLEKEVNLVYLEDQVLKETEEILEGEETRVPWDLQEDWEMWDYLEKLVTKDHLAPRDLWELKA